MRPPEPPDGASLDDATLAAFLDGTLAAAERERVLAYLAEHPGQRELLAEATALLADEAQEAERLSAAPEPTALPQQGARVGHGTRWIAAGLAAAVLALVLVPWQGPRVRDAATDGPIASWYDGRAALGADWLASAWPAVRGEADALGGRARDFRLGVRAVDARLALRARDSVAFAASVRELAELAAALPAGGVLAAELDALSIADTSAALDALTDIGRQVESSAWFGLGSWTEEERAMLRVGHRSSDEHAMERRRRLAGLLDALAAADTRDGVTSRIVERLRRIATSTQLQGPDPRQLAAVLDSTMLDAAR